MAHNNNEHNLVPNEARTPEERRENARKAGIASGKARRAKRRMREVIEVAATCKVGDPNMRAMVKRMLGEDIEEEDIDMQLAATVGMFVAAMKGNANAYARIYEALEGAQAPNGVEEDELSASLRQLRELGESL